VVFATDQKDFTTKIADADAVIVESLRVGEAELDAAPRLRAVLKFGALPTNVDLAGCLRRSVRVEVQRRRVNVAVAEHAFALLLALTKRLPKLNGLVSADALESEGFDLTPFDRRYTGNSNFARVTGLETLAGATIAIVGLGEIGREIARRAVAFEMKVLYFQRHRLVPTEEWAMNASYGSLEEVLGAADYVSLNLPVTPETRGIIDGAALAAMKSGALLINVARAELVDRAALIGVLDSGRLGGLGLDVGYEEPTAPDDPLLGRENVILTPHTAPANRWNALYDMEDMYRKLWQSLTSG
jgi:phosphoglycerate dehydrogenase-like enzyme